MAKATRDQINLAEQGQVADRYGKAVEQLGAPGPEHLEVRLGGIYALERLAQDSPRDEPTIINVLSAFVRNTGAMAGSDREPVTCPAKPIGQDVHAILTVLLRSLDNSNHPPLDLSGACLRGVDMKGMNLSGTNFAGADLSLADFSNADLARANFAHARLEKADLSKANLVSAGFSDALLNHATLTGATLKDAFFDGAQLIEAVFSEEWANADLSGAHFLLANMTKAQLAYVDLRGSSFSDTKLNGAVLAYADMRDSYLISSDLSGAELDGVHLDGVHILDCIHDAHTLISNATIDSQTVGAWW